MESTTKFYSYDDFQEEHPEIDPELRELVEPIVMGADDGIYGFVIGYLLT
ncbi:MAG: hypothetical protein LBS32_09005 [Clostridiales Family XIII bacterium]|nr:hypothetical protein [Clostridiales Family XIII bacterium]